jgi:hypothetical protein
VAVERKGNDRSGVNLQLVGIGESADMLRNTLSAGIIKVAQDSTDSEGIFALFQFPIPC